MFLKSCENLEKFVKKWSKQNILKKINIKFMQIIAYNKLNNNL